MRGVVGITGIDSTGTTWEDGFYPESLVMQRCGDLVSRQMLPKASDDGFLDLNGERFGTINLWESVLPVSGPTIAGRLDRSRSITARTFNNIQADFYPQSHVLNACADLLENLPVCDDTNFFIGENGLRFGTAGAWGLELKTPGSTIKKKLKGIAGVLGKSRGGAIYTFYPEGAVLERSANHLSEEVPRANKDGFFEANGKNFGTISAWADTLGITDKPIKKRLERVDGIDGRDARNRFKRAAFYPEDVVKAVCSDLLDSEVPKANRDGFFELEGKKYGHAYAWSKAFGISEPATKKRLRKLTGITGKDVGNHVCKNAFYEESHAKVACADLINGELQIADDSGFFVMSGEKYGTAASWARYLSVNPHILRERLAKLEGIMGKSNSGQVRIFFSENVVLDECNDLIIQNV